MGVEAISLWKEAETALQKNCTVKGVTRGKDETTVTFQTTITTYFTFNSSNLILMLLPLSSLNCVKK